MLKMMKYEFLRNRVTLLVLGGILGGSEVIFLLGNMSRSSNLMGMGMVLLVFGSSVIYFTIWLLGLISFSRDLREKSGYMVFLAPVSPYKIVFSKMLLGLLELLATGILLLMLASLDLKILSSTTGSWKASLAQILARYYGITSDELWAGCAVLVIGGAFSVLTMYSIAYLGSAIAALVSRSGNSQKWLGILFVFLILIVYIVIDHSLPEIKNNVRNEFVSAFVRQIPSFIFSAVVITGCSFGTGYLLDKKISL